MEFFLKLLVFDFDEEPEEIEYFHYCHWEMALLGKFGWEA